MIFGWFVKRIIAIFKFDEKQYVDPAERKALLISLLDEADVDQQNDTQSATWLSKGGIIIPVLANHNAVFGIEDKEVNGILMHEIG